MIKLNFPKIVIRYVVGVDITCTATSLSNAIGRQSDIVSQNFDLNGVETPKYGKKGLFLSGGSVDEITQEVSGCLMDGTYTFFGESERYPGVVGNVLSGDDYTFSTEQYITVQAKNTGDTIKAVSIVFDDIAGEHATNIKFSTEPNRVYKNNHSTFIKYFNESDNITSVKISFTKWSKKNSLAKVLKVTTTITGEYDYRTIKSMNFSDEKISNEEEVSFGVTNQFCDISLIDKGGEISALHEASLLTGDVIARIYLVNTNEEGLDDELQIGSFYLSTYENERGTNVWDFSLIDRLEKIKDVVIEPHEVEKMTIKEITDFVLEKLGFSNLTQWEQSAAQHCSSVVVPNAWIDANQYAYDVLCKCCEVGLLRIFINSTGIVRIERGL